MMKFVGASTFLNMLTFMRTLYIEGRPGGGKTWLAVALSAWLLRNGLVEQVVSNIPIGFGSKVKTPLVSSAIVLDESWIYLSDRSSVFAYAGFVRKQNHYLLLPSVYPPHRLLMRFSCERYLNLYAFGFPAWLYRWRLDRVNMKEHGYFLVTNPSDMFGYFDTSAIPSNDGGIVQAIKNTAGDIGLSEEWNDDKKSNDVIEDAIGGMEEISREVSGAAQKISRARRR